MPTNGSAAPFEPFQPALPPVEGSSSFMESSLEPPSLVEANDEDALYASLLRRKRKELSLSMSMEAKTKLSERIIEDVNNASSIHRQFRLDRVQFLRNWLGTPEELPEGAGPIGEQSANVKVPLTSTYVEQWKARLMKALTGNDVIAKFESLSGSIEDEQLHQLTKWFQWELENVVKLEEVLEDILHYSLVDGICLPIPTYEKKQRKMFSCYDFELITESGLTEQLIARMQSIFKDDITEAVEEVAPGEYAVALKDVDKPARVRFLIEKGKLIAEVERLETLFDGVKVNIPNIEDIVQPNNHHDISGLTFFVRRFWMLGAEFREECKDGGLFAGLKDDDIETIIGFMGTKSPDIVQREVSDEMDDTEGSLSNDVTAATFDEERSWLEFYAWEGTVGVKDSRCEVIAYLAVGAQKIVRLDRLEELNKEGKRSPVKFGFMKVPNRFYTIGLAQWLRHSQEEMDSIHNFRLNSGLIANIPFGFYVPAAGQPKDILQLEAGKLYPAKSKDSVWFPNIPFNPVWGHSEESLTRKYASEQAAIGDIGAGSFTSKRTSAAEFVGTAASLDIRTELIVKSFMRSLEELLYRILGLYQQHAKGRRVYQLAGPEGTKTIEYLEHDRLAGKMILRLTASIHQLSPQMERETSSLMLQLSLNQLLLSMGIVKPDTVYDAMKRVSRAYGATSLPLHVPDTEPDSPPPDVELAMMLRGEVVEPNSGENFGMHITAHSRVLADPMIEEHIPNPLIRAELARHLQATVALRDQVMMMRQQQMMEAMQMQAGMDRLGIRGGSGGQQPGQQAKPASKEEGNAMGENETGEDSGS